MTAIYGPEALTAIGSGLNRPESVHVTDAGLVVGHRGRGIARVAANGAVEIIGPDPAQVGGAEIYPNGVQPMPDGSFLFANIGDGGGVWRLTPGGELNPFLLEVDGIALSAANFVMTEGSRTWVTVSTISQPRFESYTPDIANGMIIVIEDGRPRVLADDICFANECRVTPDGRGLVIAETFGRRVTRFDLGPDGLSNRRTLAQFGRGNFPDGIRYDSAGHLWMTSIVSNRLWRIAPDGAARLIFEDSDPAHVAWVETSVDEGRMGREHFYEPGPTRTGNIASIEFSPDGETAYLGSLCGDCIWALPVGDVIKGRI